MEKEEGKGQNAREITICFGSDVMWLGSGPSETIMVPCQGPFRQHSYGSLFTVPPLSLVSTGQISTLPSAAYCHDWH